MNSTSLVKALSVFTIVYNLIEGVASIFFGEMGQNRSLMVFGLDSFIEAFSAMFILWRFHDQAESEKDKTAQKWISILLGLLGIISIIGGGMSLFEHHRPDQTLFGVLISVISLAFMFALYRVKMRLGRELNSPALIADAVCALSCLQLSVILLVGSAIFMVAPQFYFVDSIAMILIGIYILREAKETWNGPHAHEDQCCH